MTAIAVGQGPISYPRSTVDYIPKAHSKLPCNYAPVAWPVIDSDQYCHLSDGARVLYTYFCRPLDLRIKQKTRGNREYLMGRTFPKKYETIAQECWGGGKSANTIAVSYTHLRAHET